MVSGRTDGVSLARAASAREVARARVVQSVIERGT